MYFYQAKNIFLRNEDTSQTVTTGCCACVYMLQESRVCSSIRGPACLLHGVELAIY